MRIALTILFYSLCQSLFATNYYVANVGSDSNSGEIGNPFATIAKANSVAVSGDFVYLKRGDTWHEKVHPVDSVSYDAYGTGALPIITGFEALTSWANEGSNIWSKTFSNSVSYQNTVYINGTIRQKGRYPNTGYLNIDSHTGANQITGTLTGTPSYVGGEISFRNNHWVTNTGYITAQSSGTFTFTPNSYYPINDNYGYFIKNIPSVLDTANEWCIDTATKKISIYSTSAPTDVKASSIDTLVYCGGLSDVSFNNIQFEGANLCAIDVSNSTSISFNNCVIKNCGQDGLKGKQTYYLTVSNSTIKNCWNDGIILLDFTAVSNYNDSYNLTFTNNIVDSIGMASGMGKGGNQASTALDYFGNKGTIQYNSFTNTGYIATFFQGDSNNVSYNYVDTFCANKDDGGAIYTNGVLGKYFKDNYIVSNIITNGLSPVLGVPSGGNAQLTYGVYIDDYAHNITIANNTISKVGTTGINLHDCDSINLIGNTLFDNGYSNGYGAINFVNLSGGNNPNLYVTGNKMWATNQYTLGINTSLLPRLLGVVDSNYYSKTDDSSIIKYGTAKSLYQWQDSGLDIHSHITPTGITVAAPQLFYNKTNSTTVVPLAGTYKDITGISYTNLVFLKPFESVILYKANTNTTPSYTQKISQGKFINIKSL